MWLLSIGADPNLADDRGWTALHQAASRGNARMVQVLLESGADGERLTNDGEPPYILTRRKDIRKMLAQA